MPKRLAPQGLLRARGWRIKDAATRMAAVYALAHRDEGAMLTDLRDAAAAERDASDRAAVATLRKQVVDGS